MLSKQWMAASHGALKSCYFTSMHQVRSVDINLQQIHHNIFIFGTLIQTPSQFNVIPHFLAQCGSEPRTTTITAGAPTCTPLWVPQRVIKVPLVFKWSTVRRLAEVVFSHSWRCRLARIRGRTGTGFRVVKVFWQACRKGPNVVSRAAMSYYQTLNVRITLKRGKFEKSIWWVILVPACSSTDLGVENIECWEGEWGAATISVWTSAHTCGVDNNDILNPSGQVLFSLVTSI